MPDKEVPTDLISGNEEIKKLISSGIPFAIGRLGSVEAQIIKLIESNSPVPIRNRKLAWINAGVAYPTNFQLKKFSDRYTKSLRSMDVIAKWPHDNIPNQDELIEKYMPFCNVRLPIRILDPIQSVLSGISNDEIWTQALAGKNVLVVSSFSETIAVQFMHRKDLHQQTVLPEFSLHTCAPPSTNGAIFWKGSYSRNLDKCIKLIEKLSAENSIDIALISAGAYGLPIMASLKSQGISSIYMGGSLQLLFGIMGNRWRRIEAIQSLITPRWIMAPKENRPFGYRLIEDGSYW